MAGDESQRREEIDAHTLGEGYGSGRDEIPGHAAGRGDSDIGSAEHDGHCRDGHDADEKPHARDGGNRDGDGDGDGEDGLDAEAQAGLPGGRPRSRASSTRSRTLSVVPRAKRRGLFGQLALIPEVRRPYDYTNRTKWTITSIVAMAAAGAPVGSAIFYRTDFHWLALYCVPPRIRFS